MGTLGQGAGIRTHALILQKLPPPPGARVSSEGVRKSIKLPKSPKHALWETDPGSVTTQPVQSPFPRAAKQRLQLILNRLELSPSSPEGAPGLDSSTKSKGAVARVSSLCQAVLTIILSTGKIPKGSPSIRNGAFMK